MKTIYLIAAIGLVVNVSISSAAEIVPCDQPSVALKARPPGRNELVFIPDNAALVESHASLLESAGLPLESCLKRLKRCLVTYDAKLGSPEVVAPLFSDNIFAFPAAGPRRPRNPERSDLGTFVPNARLQLAAAQGSFPDYLGEQTEMLSLNAAEAWAAVTPGSLVTTAVIDAGIDLKHPEFVGQLEPGWTFHCRKGQICGGAADEFDSHGTRMAGIIAAEKTSNQGIVGVAWNTRLLPLRISTNSVSTDYLAACAISFATEQKDVKVINASWYSTEDLPLVHAALDAAVRLGKPQLIVAAAGTHFSNGDGNVDEVPSYPAVFNARNLLVVMAHDEYNVIGSQSNWGPKSVDISAPGEGLSTQNCGDKWVASCLKIPPALSTSTATAFVSGAAALLWSRYPEWNYEQIKWRLLENVHKEITHTGYNVAGGTLDLARVMLPVYLDYGDTGHYRVNPAIRHEKAFPPGLCLSEPSLSVAVNESVNSSVLRFNPQAKAYELVVSAITPGQRVQVRAECTFDRIKPPIYAESQTYVFQ